MIKFGEKIILEGFDGVNPGEITILKKIIGNVANDYGDFSKLTLTLSKGGEKNRVNALLEKDGNKKEANSMNDNLFFAINEVLSKLKQ